MSGEIIKKSINLLPDLVNLIVEYDGIRCMECDKWMSSLMKHLNNYPRFTIQSKHSKIIFKLKYYKNRNFIRLNFIDDDEDE